MSEGTAVPPFSRLSPRLLRKHSAWHIRHIPLTQNFHPQPLAPAGKADWELGLSPLAIAERLGHEKIETTLNTYSHLFPKARDEIADKLQNTF